MIIKEVIQGKLPGIKLIKIGKFEDTRGCFAELYHQMDFHQVGLSEKFVQDNLSFSKKLVLRGMHYQLEPYGMGKLISCLSGEIFDVVVDLRKGSPTYAQWEGFYLSSDDLCWLWVPVGFAHGFLSLSENTIILYKCTQLYNPSADRTLSYCCPKINIKWPEEPLIISEKDKNAPCLDEAEYNFIYSE
ncbi:MAG: dTDP-4-dehydrorhamnose 3,5-epimerase [Candidatus Hydrogenedentes bacterium]|nr:dTDP-4-dehydrorhamnose 3,5-epimerase [Candidatus Hydrogenedentota bacterium]